MGPGAAAPTIGTPVIALGDPGGRGLRATPGFVSAEGRDVRGPRGRPIAGCIEHTAPLPRGSGGGPLVDLEGRLLGLNAIRLDGGLIVAIPANARVAERVERLWSGEAVQPARLGVAIAPPRVARRLRRSVGLPHRDGLLVRSVADRQRGRRRPASSAVTCWSPQPDSRSAGSMTCTKRSTRSLPGADLDCRWCAAPPSAT